MCKEKLVLYVEDYSAVREDVINHLKKCIPELEEIETADSASETEQMLREKKYDLLLLDIRLIDAERRQNPFRGTHWTRAGKKLLELLRDGEYEADGGTPHNVPVVVISAVRNQTAMKEIIRIGRRDNCILEYFNKPVRLPIIQKAVEKTLAHQ